MPHDSMLKREMTLRVRYQPTGAECDQEVVKVRR
jgi:hypothetical protein